MDQWSLVVLQISRFENLRNLNIYCGFEKLMHFLSIDVTNMKLTLQRLILEVPYWVTGENERKMFNLLSKFLNQMSSVHSLTLWNFNFSSSLANELMSCGWLRILSEFHSNFNYSSPKSQWEQEFSFVKGSNRSQLIMKSSHYKDFSWFYNYLVHFHPKNSRTQVDCQLNFTYSKILPLLHVIRCPPPLRSFSFTTKWLTSMQKAKIDLSRSSMSLEELHFETVCFPKKLQLVSSHPSLRKFFLYCCPFFFTFDVDLTSSAHSLLEVELIFEIKLQPLNHTGGNILKILSYLTALRSIKITFSNCDSPSNVDWVELDLTRCAKTLRNLQILVTGENIEDIQGNAKLKPSLKSFPFWPNFDIMIPLDS
eukprot:TRINITY_DN13733_c0_g1_i1.p1 TRINITY_DN13733_c0_g1~~TRINITY_DN13733_c0_g1_i1.p1  ORF type:complete len:367 (+),score=40.82 TRINITY_DN13733_c0_g1_i1:336-1436(+)